MITKIVIGCPGAGKSTYLSRVSQSLPPEDTLILTYSRSAATNIARKAGPKYKASTIHALCFHNLKMIPQQMLQGDSQISTFCNHIGIEPPNNDFDRYDPLIHPWEIYSFARTSGKDPIDIYFDYSDVVDFDFMYYVRFVKGLMAYKDTFGLKEFHDLLEHYNPTSAPKNLLIDESQDNSYILTKALEKLVLCGVENLWIIGDPNQSIYSYSGADSKYMYHFGGEEVFLRQSYRCPVTVANKAKTVFPDAQFDPTKEDGEVKCDSFIPKDADMVLCRTNYIRYKILKQTGLKPHKVLTMHKSKGLEADHVVVVNATTRKVRLSTELDPIAENRLLYTAITRAKQKLTIIEGRHPNATI